jgi:hypothetical protein
MIVESGEGVIADAAALVSVGFPGTADGYRFGYWSGGNCRTHFPLLQASIVAFVADVLDAGGQEFITMIEVLSGQPSRTQAGAVE